MEATITVIVSSFLLLSAVGDYFRFGAVWILSTRRFSVVRVLFHCCGFFHFRAVWILSTRRLIVVVIDVIIVVVVVIVIVDIVIVLVVVVAVVCMK